MTKVIKAFEHRTLPGNLHFQELNPGITLEGTPFEVVHKTSPWDDEGELVAGISSFGFGGTNAHVVLSAPSAPPSGAPPPHRPASYRCRRAPRVRCAV